MPSPFPGMDPYLEDPEIWSGFHHTFLSLLQERLSPAVRPNYFVRPVAIVELADPEIHEYHLEIRDRMDRGIVTLIELLSPTNKILGAFGRESFLQKRREIMAADTHWIEIDLLREGDRTANHGASARCEYQVYLSRAGKRRKGFVWPISIRNPLPTIAIPLRGDDADVPLDLQDAFTQTFDRGGYDLDIDYRAEPVPPLAGGETAEWTRQILAERSRR